jgi:DNA-binding transcriptional LysR family regulator
MDWDKLRVFHTVALHKSLTKAGQALHLSQSAVSRQIQGLEERMGIALFHRHARGLVLSEQGEILFKTVAEMVAKLEVTEIALAENTAKPKGPFKLTAPAAFTNLWLTRQMAEFTRLYSDIEVTLLADDRELDLTLREADAAIRMYPARHPDLVQKPLMQFSNSLFASNDYLRDHGIPTMLTDLKDHKLLGFEGGLSQPFAEVNWLFTSPEAKQLGLKPHFRANSLMALRTAVKQGIGIAALPDYLMYRARHISKVLPQIERPKTQAYYIYPMELKNSKRVNVFRNFITQKIATASF